MRDAYFFCFIPISHIRGSVTSQNYAKLYLLIFICICYTKLEVIRLILFLNERFDGKYKRTIYFMIVTASLLVFVFL